jgi:DNA polymerase III subunit delta
MVAHKAHEASRVLAKPDPRWRVWLIYGPDAGLVSERVAAIITSALGTTTDDPFRLVQLDGDDVAADPLRLLDEAHTIGLFGGDKVIRISRAGKLPVSAVEALLSNPPTGTVIVIEGGDLTPKNPLRLACEKSAFAATLPCYGDDGKALGELIDSTLRAQGITIDRAARETLLGSLGSDRQLSRQELNKLLLYLGESKRVELADIEACVGDSAVRETDSLVDASFTGNSVLADGAWQRLRAEGLEPTVITGALLRHALMLLQAQMKIAGGQSRQFAGDSLRVPYPRKAAAQAMLGLWDAEMLASSIRALGQSVAEARKNSALSGEITQRAFFEIARKAKNSKN